MIIVRLAGGLGNQLFQYAAARRLAHVNQAPLKLDLSVFAGHQLRKYTLQHFNIQERFADPCEIELFNGELGRSGLARFLPGGIFRKKGPFRLFKERQFHFDAGLLCAGDNVLLDGYWQSEKYFADVSPLIREEFTLRGEPDGANQAAADEIAACNAVAMHVRRGDYVSNKETNSFHGVCATEYYRRAAEEMSAHIARPHFYIFSDDPEWVQANIHLDYPMSFLSHNDADQSHEDLRLMSLCKGHIIANSTFSWWGAWLNPDPGKTVIAPRRWFNRDDMETGDLIPSGWLSL